MRLWLRRTSLNTAAEKQHFACALSGTNSQWKRHCRQIGQSSPESTISRRAKHGNNSDGRPAGQELVGTLPALTRFENSVSAPPANCLAWLTHFSR